MTSTSFLVNGYYDFFTKSPITPYLSAGIGFANLKINDLDDFGDSSDTVLAYQVGVGLGYAINREVTLDFKYRYFATADPNFDGMDAECGSHNIYVGARYNF